MSDQSKIWWQPFYKTDQSRINIIFLRNCREKSTGLRRPEIDFVKKKML